MKAFIDPDKTWFVVRTNIKCEAKAAMNLHKSRCCDVYYPRMRVEKRNKRTNTYREHEAPLMMRYLFIGMPADKRLQHFGFVRACEGVESILGDQGNHPIPVPHSLVEAIFTAEIDMQYDDTRAARIHRKEEAKSRKKTAEMRFPKGTEVRITDGVFASFMGEVVDVTSRGEIKTLVSIFGRMAEATLDPRHLEVA